MEARIEQIVTSGTCTVDDTEYDVEVNTWVVGDDESVIVIDPGYDAETILDEVGERKVDFVICTDGRDGHLATALEVAEHDEDDPAQVVLHPRDRRLWREHFRRLAEKTEEVEEPDDGGDEEPADDHDEAADTDEADDSAEKPKGSDTESKPAKAADAEKPEGDADADDEEPEADESAAEDEGSEDEHPDREPDEPEAEKGKGSEKSTKAEKPKKAEKDKKARKPAKKKRGWLRRKKNKGTETAGRDLRDLQPDVDMEDGGVFEVADVHLEVMHTPGHTPGSVCLYSEQLGVLFSGDTLHKGKPGEIGGVYHDLQDQLNSIGGLLSPLPKETRVLPGRGEETTIGDEDAHWEGWFALAQEDPDEDGR